MGDPAHNTIDRVLVPVERKESAGCDLVRCQVCVRPVGGELSARVHVVVGRQDSWGGGFQFMVGLSSISSIYIVHSINHSNVWYAYLQSFLFILCISSIISSHGMHIINHFNSIHGMHIINHFNS